MFAFKIYMYICMPVSLYVHPCIFTALRGQKRVSDSLELELQVATYAHVGAGNQTLVPHNSSK